MNIFEIVVIGFGLAMDAFSVSLCKGITFRSNICTKSFIVSFYFGFFQFIMTLIGYCLGSGFSFLINSLDHWIVFILLSVIGFQMIFDGVSNKEYSDKTDFKSMFILSIATSIDALTVGITLSFFKIPLLLYCFLIGIITFILCFMGCFFGSKIGNRYNYLSGFIGGFILIMIAFRILFEHLHLFIFI